MQVRSAGVLLHPTALPSDCGCGDLGPGARAFVEWLELAGQTVWQILPLGPPGYGDAPYGALSAFAGSPLLISIEDLVADGLLPATAVTEPPETPSGSALDFTAARAWKESRLRESWSLVEDGRSPAVETQWRAFRDSERNRAWLDDWTLYAACKNRFEEASWTDWPVELRRRDPAALAEARREFAAEIRYQSWIQYLFEFQWTRLRSEARTRGLQIFGDVPIYVMADSADVWANQDLFELDEAGRPLSVSGVPPDAFSEDGQLWGQPIYRWDRMSRDKFAWWIERLRLAFDRFDLVRLDHFRGFAAYWSVPARAETAREGEWRQGPGAALFAAVEAALGKLDLIAEDLGVITPDVIDLRRRFDFPGMKVLQFGFDEVDSPHAPHRHNQRSVVYTGTHDNDTTCGWYRSLSKETRERLHQYLRTDGSDISWDLIRAAFQSVAQLAIVPLQDVMALGSEARFNTPGLAEGSWTWSLAKLPGAREAARLRRLTELSGRLAAEKQRRRDGD